METNQKDNPSVVREYDIGNTKFVVIATVSSGASEDAATIVRRLIRKEVSEDADRKGK